MQLSQYGFTPTGLENTRSIASPLMRLSHQRQSRGFVLVEPEEAVEFASPLPKLEYVFHLFCYDRGLGDHVMTTF
jgi:hypothetical protein